MEWFSEWWNGLELFTQVMYCVALPSTLILIIQSIMIIAGFGGDGAGVNPSDTSGLGDVDISGGDIGDISDVSDIPDVSDGGNPADLGTLHFFTIQGVITFLCVFGWSGVLIYDGTKNIVISLICAFVLGALAMYGVAKLLQATAKLAQNGTLNVKNLLGASGTVYLVIPADGKGSGKVTVTTDERCLEFDAITESGEALPDGTPIRVTDIRTGNVLVVEKL